MLVLLGLAFFTLSGCLDVNTEVGLSDLLFVAENPEEVRYAPGIFGFEIGEDGDEEMIELFFAEMYDETDEVFRYSKKGMEYLGADMPLAVIHLDNLEDLLELEELSLIVALEENEDKRSMRLALWFEEMEEEMSELAGEEDEDEDIPIDLNFSLNLHNDLDQAVKVFIVRGFAGFGNEEGYQEDVVLQSGEELEAVYFNLFQDEQEEGGLRTLAFIEF